MVRLVQGIEGLRSIEGPVHIAMGVFDGLHIGHQAVIRNVVEAAQLQGGTAVMLTFDPHPIQVLAPHVAPRRILVSLEHKRKQVELLGIKVMAVVEFTGEFATFSAQYFLNLLLESVPCLRTLAVGADWRFGKNREGDVSLLEKFGQQHGIEILATGAVMLDGERVSSTRIRQAIRDGNLKAAKAMLGREYSVLGTVVAGRQLGRTLGFPTANLKVHSEQLPTDGVWCVEVTLENGELVKGVANLGVRPTVEEGEARRSLEIHLLDFDRDLYGRSVEVRFLKFLRGEKQFASLEDLQAQIRNDVDDCRRALL